MGNRSRRCRNSASSMPAVAAALSRFNAKQHCTSILIKKTKKHCTSILCFSPNFQFSFSTLFGLNILFTGLIFLIFITENSDLLKFNIKKKKKKVAGHPLWPWGWFGHPKGLLEN
jgi:hypothetical protein